jgi:hypothetical protein
MELEYCLAHERGETVIFERGLGEAYAEARAVALATRLTQASGKGEESLRVIRDRILTELAARGWIIDERIFPPSAPAIFQRGNYRLDAAKTTGSDDALGFIYHVGSSEFLVRKLMLTSEAVRRRVVGCCVLALMTRNTKPYVAGRPASYEQAERLLRAYGQSAFRGIPMVLWGLAPDPIFAGQVGRSVRVRVMDT